MIEAVLDEGAIMMNMQLVSVNLGRAEAIANAKASGKTGIFKREADGPVWVSKLGLQGDTICDTKNHGGVDQAVYVYGMPDYEWWSAALDRALAPGTFGENLTIAGLESARLFIGDRLRVGEVVLEITAPRIPCVTLAQRMGDPAFVKRFRAAERPGLYCRVLREGLVQAGEPVVLAAGARGLSAIEMFRDFFAPQRDEATLRRHLAAPIAIRDREEKEMLLHALEAQRGKAMA